MSLANRNTVPSVLIATVIRCGEASMIQALATPTVSSDHYFARQRVYACADILEMMQASPICAVENYLLCRGYTKAEIREACTLVVMSRTPASV